MEDPTPRVRSGRLGRWLATALAIFFGVPRRPCGLGLAAGLAVAGPHRARSRRRAGRQPARRGSGLSLQLHAGTLQANDTLSSSFGNANADVARFAARSVLIQGLSDHVLMQRVAGLLLEH